MTIGRVGTRETVGDSARDETHLTFEGRLGRAIGTLDLRREIFRGATFAEIADAFLTEIEGNEDFNPFHSVLGPHGLNRHTQFVDSGNHCFLVGGFLGGKVAILCARRDLGFSG